MFTNGKPIMYANEPKPDSYFKFNKTMCKISGFLFLSEKLGIFYRAINLGYFLFLDFILCHVSVLTLVDFYRKFGRNLPETAYDIITVFANLCVFGMQVMVQFRHKELKELFDFAEHELSFRSARGLSVITLGPSLKSAHILCAIVNFFTLTGVLQWVVDPLIETNQTGRRTLPFNVEYPFDVYITPWYQIAFIMQAANELIIVLCTVTLVNNYITLSTIVRAQYLILSSSARNACATGALRAGVRYDVLARTCSMDMRQNHEQHEQEGVELGDCRFDCHGAKEIEVPQMDVTKKSKQNMYHLQLTSDVEIIFSPYESLILEAVKDCGRHHYTIREFCALLEHYIAPPVMLHILTLVVEIAVSLFTATLTFKLKTAAYLTLSGVYLLLYCFYGTLVLVESKSLGSAAWEATLTGGGRRVDRALAVLMTQYARPMQLKSSKMFTLNLQNYILCIKTSFSFYTLLQALKNK